MATTGLVQLEVLAIFVTVFALIVLRRVGRFKIEIWLAMLLGAILFLTLGIVSLGDAFRLINMNILAFLFGTFAMVEVMAQTGLLQYLAIRFLRTAKTPARLLLITLIFVGFASAFLVNDAVVLVMTPIAISACAFSKVRTVPYLLAVALASNIGSALTPIGNPQNILIKIASSTDTIYWFSRMALPTVLGICSAYFILRWVYRKDVGGSFSGELPEPGTMLTNRTGAIAIGVIAVATVLGFLTSDLTGVPIAMVALAGGFAALLISSERGKAVKEIDWGTLIFFAAMFIVMGTVASSGLLDYLFAPFTGTLFASGSSSVLSIFGMSLLVSQVTSNVPFVAIALPIFLNAKAGSAKWLSLAAGSTLAGNATLLGAAANIIVLEAAERRGSSFSYAEFLKAGIPVALATSAITAIFLILTA
ncbi:MAG: SLC13 family permease [Candidatus Methanomethylicaceae archaeon]